MKDNCASDWNTLLEKMLKLALHLYLGVLTTILQKSRTFLVVKAMLFATKYLLKLFSF